MTLNEHLAEWMEARRLRRMRRIELRLIGALGAITLVCAIAVAVDPARAEYGDRDQHNGTNSPSDATGGSNAGWWSHLNQPRYGVFVPANQDLCGGDCDPRTFVGPYSAGPHPGLIGTVYGWFRAFDQASRTGGAPGYGGWSW